MRNDLFTPRPDWGIAVLRVVVGVVFLMHGGQKLFLMGIPNVAGFLGQMGFPLPMLSAVALTAAEFLGGLALLLGLFTRWAAIPLAFTMLVAMLAVHLKGGFFLPQGFEYTLVLLAANVALIFLGSGSCAVDRLLEKRGDQPALKRVA